MSRIRRSLLLALFTAGCSSATGPGVTGTHPEGVAVSPAPTVGARPFGVAVSSKDVAFVGRQDVPYVQRTTLPDLAFADSDHVGFDTDDIAFNSTGTRAYITNLGGHSLTLIDVATGSAFDSLPYPAGPVRILIAAGDASAFVSAADGSVSLITLATKTPMHRWTFNGLPNGLSLTGSGTILYVATMAGSVYKLNSDSTGSIDSVAIAGTAQDIALTPDDRELFVANESGTMKVYNAATLALIDTVKGAAGAFGLKATPDGVQLYATYPGSGTIKIIDRATRTVVSTLSVTGTPRRIAFGQAGATALIPNEAGFVTVVH